MNEKDPRHENTSVEIPAIIAEVQSPLEAAAAAQEAAAHEKDEAVNARFAALEARVSKLEAALAASQTVEATAAKPATGRRTHGAGTRMLAKGEEPAGNAGVDAALGSLSLEQRFAVKAGLLRAGLL